MIIQTLTCQMLVERVTDYLEHALRTDERAQVEAHLAVCSHCRCYLEQMYTTISLLAPLRSQGLYDDRSGAAAGRLAWRSAMSHVSR